MTKRFFILALSLLAASASVVFSARPAAADETTARPGTVTLKPTTVVGRTARPSVVIEIARAKADVKLPDLAEPAVEKIIRAASPNARAPF